MIMQFPVLISSNKGDQRLSGSTARQAARCTQCGFMVVITHTDSSRHSPRWAHHILSWFRGP